MAISTAIDASAVARVLGVKTAYVDLRPSGATLLPQRIAVLGQGGSATLYSTAKRQVTSAQQAAELYGFGSPLHLAVSQLLPRSGGGVGTIPVTVYPLEAAETAVAAAGDITPSGTQTIAASYRIKAGNINSQYFVISPGDSVADITAAITDAINGSMDMPISATDNTTNVGVTAKWAGETGNDINIVIEGSSTAGVAFAVTQPTGGLVNPDVSPALEQMGSVWETLVLNCLNLSDSDALTAIETVGEGRWGPLQKKPFVSFVGTTETDLDALKAITDQYATYRNTAVLSAPASNDLPLTVAAAQLAKIAVLANNNPAHDYGLQRVPAITPGPDAQQWDYLQRDTAVKMGVSTIEVLDNVANISDVVTLYRPSGDPLPAYRYVVDIIKLQNFIFNLNLKFNTNEWAGAPLIPDDQPTSNRTARKPKAARAEVAAIVDGLALEAILSAPETAKQSIMAGINESNPKRLDLSVTVQLSGNANIISVDLNFGFYFGQAALAA